jgi:hypothetical protein
VRLTSKHRRTRAGAAKKTVSDRSSFSTRKCLAKTTSGRFNHARFCQSLLAFAYAYEIQESPSFFPRFFLTSLLEKDGIYMHFLAKLQRFPLFLFFIHFLFFCSSHARLLEKDGIYMRFLAKLQNPQPEDTSRRFVITFHLDTEEVIIFEVGSAIALVTFICFLFCVAP